MRSSTVRLLLIAAVLLPAATTRAQEEVEAGPSRAVVSRTANLRARADGASRILGVLQEGSAVTVVGGHEGWRRVRANGRTGWIAGDLLAAQSPAPAFLAAARAAPCAEDLDDCPETGCADTPEEVLLHARKRRQVRGRPIPLSMQDFVDLQQEADETIGQGATVSEQDMTRLRRALRREGGAFLGEGKTVEFFGFVVGEPKGSGAENVNCNLTSPNVDFHINVADGPNRKEHKSIVVEMIPQGRSEEWTTRKLKKIERDDLPVRVIGQLFYDNKHFVRDGRPANERRNQSKRHSLWEIHPVTKFLVCPAGDCEPEDREGWVALEDWPG